MSIRTGSFQWSFPSSDDDIFAEIKNGVELFKANRVICVQF